MAASRSVCALVSAVALCLNLSSVAAAQTSDSSIAGVARDSTGAVLPGVTVEASSPALIEKVRSVVTDDQGQYKIINLRPGTYAVTFTLPGFSNVRTEGIELTGSFTAAVNAEMRVGSLEETITVTGASPTIDTQNVVQRTVLSSEVIHTIPSGKTLHNMAALIPGASMPLAEQDVGGSQGEALAGSVTMYGSRPADMGLQMDGMRFNGTTMSGGGGGGVKFNAGTTREAVVEQSGISAEHELGGPRTNVIPKEGGNSFTGFLAASLSNDALSADNMTEELRSRGITAVNRVQRIWDFNPAGGGRIMRDRLWVYGGVRLWGAHQELAGTSLDTNSQDFVYTPDPGRIPVRKNEVKDAQLRLTWQATRRNKINFSNNLGHFCNCQFNLSPTTTFDASGYFRYTPNYVTQVAWTSPLTTKLLLEGGFTHVLADFHFKPQPHVSPDTIAAMELSTGIQFRAPAAWLPRNRNRNIHSRFAASYVTGSHAFKTGVTFGRGNRERITDTNSNGLYYLLFNGQPAAMVLFSMPTFAEERLNWNLGVFAQDQWTVKRVTLNMGVRLDSLNASVPSQSTPATRFLPSRSHSEIDNVPNWNDVSPRLGLAYDVFGNGKTAIKAEIGRFVVGTQLELASVVNPSQATVTNTSRTWADRNRDFNPDCNLSDPLANGECGPYANNGFGTLRILSRYDPDYLEGWGKRQTNWLSSIGVDQELLQGVRLNASYHRRVYNNFTAIDNLLASPADYDPFCITAPQDPRLPDGGGGRICDVYDIKPSVFGRVDNLVTRSSNFGEESEVYDGVDVTLSGRLPRGIFLSGGLSTGRTATNNCFAVDSPVQSRVSRDVLNVVGTPSNAGWQFCDVNPLFWQPQVKFVGSYPLPWWGLQFSGTLQSVQGPEIRASYVATNAQIAPSLGRNLSAGANGTVMIDLMEPGKTFEDRVNQIDVRFSKMVRLGGTRRIHASFDVYNAFNASSILGVNTRYGPAWLRPTSVLTGRVMKLGVQADF